METRQGPPSSEFINEKSNYIKSLKEAGFTMREVRGEANPFNAIVYKNEQKGENFTKGKSNLLLIPGALGESASTAHIGAAFLSEFDGELGNVMNFNAALSRTGFEAGTYNHDLDQHVEHMVALYEDAIPDEEKKDPLVLLGHSMGGATAPKLAERLLEKGIT